MNDKKRIAIQRHRIDKLTIQVSNLKQQNATIMQENQSLKRANSDKEKNIHQLKKAFQKIQSDYQNELNNLEFFKQKYSDIISEITDVKRKYLKEAKQSLKQFKKQNE